MSFHIAGMGTALPEHSISQSDAVEIVQHFGLHTDLQRDFLRGIYLGSGINSRGSVLLQTSPEGGFFGQSFFQPATDSADSGPTTAQRIEKYCNFAPDLAVAASEEALHDSGLAPAKITHLVTVSCTGFHAPGVDIQLIERLGLPREVARTHIGYMGCHGSLNALRVADAFVRSNPRAVVLVASVELCSLHLQYGPEPEKIVSHALFADGAGAVVGTSTTTSNDSWKLRASGSCLLPDSQQDMTWQLGNHGFEMSLSARIPELIGLNLKSWLTSWLHSLGMTLADIRSWAIHPGGPKILKACGRALSLSREQLKIPADVLADHGNMSSATLLFILKRMREKQMPRPCIAMGFGPGLCFEAVLWE